jgi:hypothetical protein
MAIKPKASTEILRIMISRTKPMHSSYLTQATQSEKQKNEKMASRMTQIPG